MVRKSLLTFSFLIIIFCLALQLLIPNTYMSPKSTWQTNLIKAQKFIYNTEKYDNIIVGSSLSAGIDVQNIYNLSLYGLSVYDGLRIISQTDHHLKNIFIETNFILKNETQEFNSQLNYLIPFYLKKYIPPLRDGKQPVVLAVESIRKIADSKKRPSQGKVSVNKDLFNELVADYVSFYSKIPTPDSLMYYTTQLKGYVRLLEAKGTRVNFFEMPVNEKLCGLPKSVIIRSLLYRNFPPPKYYYISQPTCANYQTTDGVHLNEQEIGQYTTYFDSKILIR